MIANSGSDSRGKFSGDAAGDQTGKEWYLRSWYNRPWNCVIRSPDLKVREMIAQLATEGANNDLIGYDQNERWTFWEQLKKSGYRPAKIKTKCEADCSSGVISITWAAGYLLSNGKLMNLDATYTGNMRAGYKAAGFQILTDSRYLTSDQYLIRGDILLNDQHHTAVNLTTGKYGTNGAPSTESTEISTGGNKTVIITMLVLMKGSTGYQVKTLQRLLTEMGFSVGSYGIDGDFGDATKKAVEAFQRSAGLEVDGIVGANTWTKLLKG